MKNSLNFLIESSKLKEIPRTGWVIRGVKNPETIADHTFRMVFGAWLLGRNRKLSIKRLLKLAVYHDLCEIYAGDNTPFFYYQKIKQGDKKFLSWVRLSQKEKEKLGQKKFNIEKAAIKKLTRHLRLELKGDVYSSWLDFENKYSAEARFIRQIDRVETFLQAISYLGVKKSVAGSGWWEEIEEVIEDKILLDFLHIIQNKYYNRNFPGDKELENILDFLANIEKLKRMSRTYWVLRGIKNPETVAGHIFTLCLMVLLFGGQKRALSMEKMLKMALCHEITALYTKDVVPYYSSLPQNKKELRKTLSALPRQLGSAKIRKFSKDYELEIAAIKKATLKLDPPLKKEIIQLWKEYRNRSSAEGNFLNQLNVLAVLLQALIYRQKNKKFSVQAIWEWVFETCDDPICISLIDEMKRRFH